MNLCTCAVLLGVLTPGSPRLGQVQFASDELWTPISFIDSPDGHGNVAMVQGYLFVPFSSDGGGGSSDGGFEFWDVTDPRDPVLVKRYDNESTHGLREAHGFTLAWHGERLLLAAQSIEGVQIWDLTDPLAASLVSAFDLPGIDEGDYTGAWWTFWQAPMLFVAGVDAGLYIVDASIPEAPILVTRMSTGELAGVAPAQVFVLGNMAVLMESQGLNLLTLDVSNPSAPSVLQRQAGRLGYSHIFAGPGQILTSGSILPQAHFYQLGHNGSIRYEKTAGIFPDSGGYGSYQDGVFHSGFSRNYAAFDVASASLLGTGSSDRPDRDEDFAAVLGNFVFVGNDHGTGSALIAHSAAPDTTPPTVEWWHPAPESTDLPSTTRFGLSFSDHIDTASLSPDTFWLENEDGERLPVQRSSQLSLVNISPLAPLNSFSAYRVVVEGVRDVAGNPAARTEAMFFTGDVAPQPTLPCSVHLLPSVTGTVELSATIPDGAVASWQVGDQVTTTNDETIALELPPGRHPVLLTVRLDDARGTCAGVQIVHRPLAPTPPRSSSRLVWDREETLNANPDNRSVTRANKDGVAWETRLEGRPQTLAILGDELWVLTQEPSAIAILDSQSGIPLRKIALSRGSRPFGLVVDDRGFAHITLEASGEVITVASDGTITNRLYVMPRVHGISFFEGDLFVTRFVSPADRGEVARLSAANLEIKSYISLEFDPGPDTEASGRGVPNYVAQIAISPDGSTAFVPSKKDNVARGLTRDGEPLTFESRVRTIVSAIDLSENRETLSRRLDVNDRELIQSVAISPFGDLLLAASQGINTVDVFETETGRRIAQFDTGRAPQALSFDSSGARLAVYNFLSRSVSYFDTSSLVSGRGNEVHPLGETTTVASEVLTDTVLAGKRLFYDASDPRMSRDGYLSCASCHLDGEDDGQVWDFTQSGEGLRNTISLRGRRGLGHGALHWTANFDEVQDFEKDIRESFGGTGFLSDSDYEATSAPLGPKKAGLSTELDALAAYVSSLDSYPESPFRNDDGSFTDTAIRGREIFVSAGCAECHAGEDFRDGKRHDVGTIRATSGKGLGEALTGIGFETPTLRGVFATAPYFHDGSAATLSDVLNVHGATPTLNPQERAYLVNFLQQLDGSPSFAPRSGEGGGCGCTSGPSAPWALIVLGAALARSCFRRRNASLPRI